MRYVTCIVGTLLFTAVCWADNGCDVPRPTDRAIVSAIIDGDTLRLRDGRRVRLVGVDTPELESREQPGEPFSQEAKHALASMLPKGTTVTLAFDLTPRDKYERTLAFAFGAEGMDVQRRLLALGLATALVVPPRKYGVGCYQRVEAQARRVGLGIWALARYRGIQARRLSRSATGFHIVRGTVERVGSTRSAIWLNLADNVAVRIPRDDLVHFEGMRPRLEAAALRGARIEARGWLYERNRQQRLTVRHPAALTVLETP